MRERMRVSRVGEPFAEKYPRLLAELEECFREGERLMGVPACAISPPPRPSPSWPGTT